VEQHHEAVRTWYTTHRKTTSADYWKKEKKKRHSSEKRSLTEDTIEGNNPHKRTHLSLNLAFNARYTQSDPSIFSRVRFRI
jgi:hypothetical protein